MAGTAIAERGLTLDMSRMREVTVDPDRRLAQVGPGCLLRDVDRATQAHGLATPLGSFASDVGVAGLTLGGGLGYLAALRLVGGQPRGGRGRHRGRAVLPDNQP